MASEKAASGMLEGRSSRIWRPVEFDVASPRAAREAERSSAANLSSESVKHEVQVMRTPVGKGWSGRVCTSRGMGIRCSSAKVRAGASHAVHSNRRSRRVAGIDGTRIGMTLDPSWCSGKWARRCATPYAEPDGSLEGVPVLHEEERGLNTPNEKECCAICLEWRLILCLLIQA